MKRSLIIIGLVLAGAVFSWAQWKVNRDWKSVERILGTSGEAQMDGFKVSVPRSDLNVLVHGLWIEPRAGLSSWFTFKPMTHGVLLIGEVVVVDWEVPKVEAQLESQAFTLLSIYRPFNGETPGVERIRFMGKGSRVSLAQGAKALLTATSMPSTSQPVVLDAPTTQQTAFSLPLEKLLGPGTWQGTAFQENYASNGTITEDGEEIPSYMRGQTTFNFQPDGQLAKVYGQWVVPMKGAGELMAKLIQQQFVVTGTHSDLLNASPELVEVHFWAEGNAEKIAKGLLKIVHETKSVSLPPTPAAEKRQAQPQQ